MKPVLLSACALSALLAGSVSAAPVDTWLAQARQQHLADQPYWRLLLRYESVHHGKPASLIHQPMFFVSPHGERDPDGELDALLRALAGPAPANPYDAVACRFPARTAWLREQLAIDPQTLPVPACPALDAWRKGINPAQATLVFAADYVNNPSSMFGHTLLRLDAPEQTEATRLLAYAVNYAAQTNTSNGLEFAYKGLTGGYPGMFSVLPYYEKVKEYNDFENRDLWEYQLNLSPAELDRLLGHLWEMKGVQLPYYFLASNCSYQLLGLFEAARPGLMLRKDFPVYAIPTDTLRRVLAEKDVLRSLVYRPASSTALVFHGHENGAAVNARARRLADDPDAGVSDLTPTEQARAFEMAYDFLYYRFLGHDVDARTTPARLRALLVKRSTYAEPDSRKTVPQPVVDPAHGHDTARLGLGGGYGQHTGFISLDYRPAYHDLLDSDNGYRRGAAIDFLRGQLRYYPDDHQVKVQRFVLVGIDSLAPRDDFLKPLSWTLAVGAKQVAMDRGGTFSEREHHTVGFVDGGSGVSREVGMGGLCFGFIQGELQGGPALDDGWRVGLGPRLGCRYQVNASQVLVEVQSLFHQDSERFLSTVKAGFQHQLGERNAVRMTGQAEQEGGKHWWSAELGWLRYF